MRSRSVASVGSGIVSSFGAEGSHSVTGSCIGLDRVKKRNNNGCASIMSMVPMMHDTLQVSAYVQMCNEDASLYLAHIKANFPDLG